MNTIKLPIFQIDAFTTEQFKGNYAAVVPLRKWLSSEVMQSIATENNLSETAFYIQTSDGTYEIRWFSPIKEVDFCGHATLASAYVIFETDPDKSVIEFLGKTVGRLTMAKQPDGAIEMDFPNRKPEPIDAIPSSLLEGLSIKPIKVLKNKQAYFAVYADEKDVRAVVPNLEKLKELGPLDVVVTSPGEAHDFVSRYFWPANGGAEDPVTGSIHAGLAPFWAERFGKLNLSALQASQRSGLLQCRVLGDRVYIIGNAVKYLEGTISIQVKSIDLA